MSRYLQADPENFDLQDLKCKFDVILLEPPLEEYYRESGISHTERFWTWDDVSMHVCLICTRIWSNTLYTYTYTLKVTPADPLQRFSIVKISTFLTVESSEVQINRSLLLNLPQTRETGSKNDTVTLMVGPPECVAELYVNGSCLCYCVHTLSLSLLSAHVDHETGDWRDFSAALLCLSLVWLWWRPGFGQNGNTIPHLLSTQLIN